MQQPPQFRHWHSKFPQRQFPKKGDVPQEIKHDFRELEREVWYKKSGQQVGSPVSPVQDQQIAAQNNDP